MFPPGRLQDLPRAVHAGLSAWVAHCREAAHRARARLRPGLHPRVVPDHQDLATVPVPHHHPNAHGEFDTDGATVACCGDFGRDRALMGSAAMQAADASGFPTPGPRAPRVTMLNREGAITRMSTVFHLPSGYTRVSSSTSVPGSPPQIERAGRPRPRQ